MRRIKLARGEVVLNEPLPWTIYAANGQLLLRQGRVITSDDVLSKIFLHDPYRNIEMILGNEERHKSQITYENDDKEINPFNEITRFSTRYKNLTKDIEKQDKTVGRRVLRLAQDIQALVAFDEDACLGAIHLYYDQTYTALQPIYKAILCELTASLLDYENEQRLSLLAAALTANLGLVGIQDQLNNQNSPLTGPQIEMIQSGPARSVEILKSIDITDQVWLKTVIENHERNDGTGYPWGLKSRYITPFAKILGLADTYVAMITRRAYRKAALAQTVLQEIYQMSTAEDRLIYSNFIRQLGVYPPGTMVTLENGEVAVVTYRGFGNSIMSSAMSFGKEPGHFYASPIKRDTSLDEFKISKIYNPTTKPHLNPDMLWSYR
jgi:HD-GYP domain-containing protein (c-di-GMP phosphodiesterase class II)